MSKVWSLHTSTLDHLQRRAQTHLSSSSGMRVSKAGSMETLSRRVQRQVLDEQRRRGKVQNSWKRNGI